MGSTQSHTPRSESPQAPGAFPVLPTTSSTAPAASTSRKASRSRGTAPPPAARSLFPPKFLLAVADLVYGTSTPDVYVPTHQDIAEAYEILQEHRLPPELVPSILDRAEYWFVSRVTLKREVTVVAGSRTPRQMVGAIVRWRNGQEDDLIEEIGVEDSGLKDAEGKLWYLVTEPIGSTQAHAVEEGSGEGLEQDENEKEQDEEKLEMPKAWLKKIVVDTLSKDQGWTTSNAQHYGTYEQSYTWFELSLLRNGKEVEGSRVDFQHNVHAGQHFKNHTTTLDQGHRLVRMAQAGDRVVLWVRAQHPGWINHLREATITLFESPFPPQN